MSDDSVRVAVRIRPLVDSERTKGCVDCLNLTPGQPQIRVSDKAFTYDYVFGSSTEQDVVYNEAVEPMVNNIFKGYNVTILAYGQTGSGKTYSMGTNYSEGQPMGVIPRAVSDIFKTISLKTDWKYKVTVSFIELYQEQVYDLLSEKTRKESILDIREEIKDETKGIKVVGLSEIEVKNVDDTFKCLSQGSAGRATGATNMNNQSSRSHAIFTITVYQQKIDDNDTAMTSKFQLVDLAGSERSKKTGATGERFKEGVNINKGLLALGNVISALGDNNSSAFIGYRDSKLTRLLQDSLGGNSMTLMIACVSPADYNIEETLSTLRYADRAKKIKNKPIINQDPRTAEINRLKELVKQLQLSALGKNSGILSCPPEHSCLSEKNRTLQKKLRELSEQLHTNLIETMCMNERAELAEEAKNKMDEGLIKIIDEFKCIINDNDIDNDLRIKLKQLYDKILQLHDYQKQKDAEIIQQISLEGDPSMRITTNNNNDEFDDSLDSSIEGIQLDEKQAEHTIRQSERNNEVQNINRALAIKEELVSRLLTNASQLAESKELQDMENEIKSLQNEKEQLLKLLEETQVNSASAKLAETRRKKLQELEKKITELNKKCVEQGRIIKNKEKTDQQLKNLTNEIQTLKQTRVKLIREMRKESEKFSQWKLAREKELLRLKDQDRKRQNQMIRLQSLHNKQQNVFKRKMEEASAINKRLKDAFDKQCKAGINRQEKSKSKETMKTWIKQEIDVLIGTVDAKCSLEKLMNDRAHFKKQHDEIKNGYIKNPTNKIQQKLDDLSAYIDVRSVQISELQNQIIKSDQELRTNSRLDAIQTVADARIVMKELFESISDVEKKYFQKNNDYDDLMSKYDQLLMDTRQAEIKRIAQSNNHENNDDDIDDLKKQIESLKNENKLLNNKINDNQFLQPVPIKKKKTSIKVDKFQEDDDDDFVMLDSESDMSFTDDADKDPDWRGTPIAKRVAIAKQKMKNQTIIHQPESSLLRVSISTRLAKKRASEGNSPCECKTSCATSYCLCRKDHAICSEKCGCDPVKCQNQENRGNRFFLADENPKRIKVEDDN
ncbi:chromosome-associated kinesin KIF4 [Aphidius gifuensis]|uniref:chromosome-associated kinesin KIF4 n=1 Tax=Aphidius gifuensis TaxID=684658 RepID=UPI001CDC13BC|nr:chromosome-associated kinesin KIF4 [Aphidius gifuensis]XP_044019739.1 chromosome-associated kinesin KIF4 [Aphidius gifuensis]